MIIEDIKRGDTPTTIATIGADGHPQPCDRYDAVDKKGMYFLTAKGKPLCTAHGAGYAASISTKDKKQSPRQNQNIHSEKLDEIFGKIHTCRKFIPAIRAARVFRVYEPRRMHRHHPHPGRHRPAPNACTARPMRRRRVKNDSQKRAIPLFSYRFMGIVIR